MLAIAKIFSSLLGAVSCYLRSVWTLVIRSSREALYVAGSAALSQLHREFKQRLAC